MVKWLSAAAVAAAVLLSGCSHDAPYVVDQAAWGAALSAQGVNVTDWPKYRATMASICAEDDPSMYVAVALDKGTTLRKIETDYQYACPERMPVLMRVESQLRRR